MKSYRYKFFSREFVLHWKMLWRPLNSIFRKQAFTDVLQNRCPYKFRNIHRKTPATILNKRLQHRCFLVNIAKFLRTTFSIEHLLWLLLIFNVFWCVPKWLVKIEPAFPWIRSGLIVETEILKSIVKNTLKAFDGFKNKQQNCMKYCFLLCKSIYFLKVYSVHYTLR